MTNKTITLSSETVERITQYLPRGVKGSEELIDTLRAALAEPVPPAGGEPEVLVLSQGESVASAVFNDPLYNAESDARNASALLEEVLEWFDDGAGRSPAEFKLMRKIGDWLGRSAPSIDGGSDKCDHSESNKIGCPECGEVFK